MATLSDILISALNNLVSETPITALITDEYKNGVIYCGSLYIMAIIIGIRIVTAKIISVFPVK
ncbi:MAG: hypothetical protein PQ967_03660 [Methanobacterium sp.]